MWYNGIQRKGMRIMDGQITDLYKLPNIKEYEDIHLLTLSEHCAVLEGKVYAIANDLSDEKRYIIESYISTRNDLEVETVKVALRWGKKHYQ